MSTIPNLSASMEEPPSTAGTVGIEKECVDPYTLQMIDQLFPGHHGIQFLAGILRQASVKQLALPELAVPEGTDVAVITVQSIRTLARLIGFSYDTTEKYIVVLSQLRLLHKKRYRRQIILHFPLCRCQVPDPEALESLDYRPKVTSFAGQVKRRIVLLRTSGNSLPPSPSLTVVQGDAPRLAPRLVEDIRQILQQEVDSETGSRLLLRIEGAVRYRCTQSQSLLSEQKGDSELVTSGQQSRLLDGKGDSLTGGISQERRLREQKGDSESGADGQQSPLFEKGDSELATSGQQSRLLDGKGDSLTGGISQERRLREQKGDLLVGKRASIASESPFGREKGDFQGAEALASLNDNVITPSIDSTRKDDVIDNDAMPGTPTNEDDRYSKKEAARVGQSLANFFEHRLDNTGGFVNKCKMCTRTTIRAAVIDALVHAYFPTVDPADERGRPLSRAAWFHDACNRFSKPGTVVPLFVLRWLHTDLDWQQIELALRDGAAKYARYMTANGRQASLVRQWLRGELTNQELDDALRIGQGQTVDPDSATNGKPYASADVVKTWMDQGEANALAAHVLQEGGALQDGDRPGVTKAVVDREQGAYVVKLLVQNQPLTVKNPQEWTALVERVQKAIRLRQQLQGDHHGTTK